MRLLPRHRLGPRPAFAVLVALVAVGMWWRPEPVWVLVEHGGDDDADHHRWYGLPVAVVSSKSTPKLSTNSTTTTKHSSSNNHNETPTTQEEALYPPFVWVDRAAPHPRPLINPFLLGPYHHGTNATTPHHHNNNNTNEHQHEHDSRRLLGPSPSPVPAHDMDVVVVAAGPDSALAASIHNLWHLCGFRRFVFVVNDAAVDCPVLFDLVPQHHSYPTTSTTSTNNNKPHVCLGHDGLVPFHARARLEDPSEYPGLREGAPGLLKRGNRKVRVPRLGWYLQQFSKLLVGNAVPDLSPRYLAVDGDLVFTRPVRFANATTTILPITTKSPQQWRYFYDWIFGGGDNEDGASSSVLATTTHHTKKKNFVVGWMVLDREILDDLIAAIDRNVQDPRGDSFPLSILNEGERVLNTTFFSEFYVYARFVLAQQEQQQQQRQHPPHRYNYLPQKIPEPARNPGGFQHTCVLTKKVYRSAQENPKLAPFLIWEEHKHHAFDSCPDQKPATFPGDASANHHHHPLTRLSTIGIWHDFHPPPWGGGNQFLLALRGGLSDDWGCRVLGKNDPALPVLPRPPTKKKKKNTKKKKGKKGGPATASEEEEGEWMDGREQIRDYAQAVLANAITFKGKTEVLDGLKATNNLALVHRVDGPYYSTRYGRDLDRAARMTARGQAVDLPPEDQKTRKINRKYACATVFQSDWSMEANHKIGLTDLRNPVVIPNTVDPSIFYPVVASNRTTTKQHREGRRIRIVATSHSDNARKGFDTMAWLDQHLDFRRFELAYLGGIPKTGFRPTNITVLRDQRGSEGVAAFLRTGDVYLAPSREEPASNAVLEALACGLPVLYQEGSSHGDLVGSAGVGFARAGPGLLEALEELVRGYDDYAAAAARVPSRKEVSRDYLAILRWCFYMKHLFGLDD